MFYIVLELKNVAEPLWVNLNKKINLQAETKPGKFQPNR